MSAESEIQCHPLVTVVTVSYNAAATIEKTIKSVLEQSYPNIEYIVIDGGSTDGTVDIIKKYQDRLAYWVSEPDKGIYDAMNKGILKTTGEWINFMNCGDTFYDREVVEKVFEKNSKVADVIYGDHYFISDSIVDLRQAESLDLFLKEMPFCHQAAFIRTDILRKELFDLKYRICADHKFFYSLWKRGGDFRYVPVVVSVYDTTVGSISSDNYLACTKEFLCILKDEKTLKKLPLYKKYICCLYRYIHHKLHLLKLKIFR